MVTSRAVVGSSAMINFGLHASAIAITTRCFMPPEPTERIEGCIFNPRCPNCMEICTKRKPGLSKLSPTHEIKCFLYSDNAEEEGTK